jgi:hypothetical protein
MDSKARKSLGLCTASNFNDFHAKASPKVRDAYCPLRRNVNSRGPAWLPCLACLIKPCFIQSIVRLPPQPSRLAHSPPPNIRKKERSGMGLRWLFVVAVVLGFSPAEAFASEGIFHRASCSVVRYYVAKYSAPAAEAWARSKGASEAEIEAARRCLNAAPTRTIRTAQEMN